MRIDTVNHFLGLRLNVWTALILFVLAVVAFIVSAKRYPGQEDISTGPAAGKPATDASVEPTEANADATTDETSDPATASEPPAESGAPDAAGDSTAEGKPQPKVDVKNGTDSDRSRD